MKAPQFPWSLLHVTSALFRYCTLALPCAQAQLAVRYLVRDRFAVRFKFVVRISVCVSVRFSVQYCFQCLYLPLSLFSQSMLSGSAQAATVAIRLSL